MRSWPCMILGVFAMGCAYVIVGDEVLAAQCGFLGSLIGVVGHFAEKRR